jgi:hypothetical protein
VTWGLDIMITTEGAPVLRPAGSVGWCGTFNTFHWLDPRHDLAAALHMQYLPLFEPRCHGPGREVRTIVTRPSLEA